MKWTLQDLIDRTPNLVLVIDLTNTNRYYNPRNLKKLKKKRNEAESQQNNEEHTDDQLLNDINISSTNRFSLHSNGRVANSSVASSHPDQLQVSNQNEEIKYIKIYTQGHVVPDNQVVQRFFNTVDESIRTQNDGLIGVHCTHGVNRTGYLICRYLIERLQWNPDKAIAAFEKNRGHPIERKNYLNDLRRASWVGISNQENSLKSNEAHEKTFPCFTRPEQQYKSEDSGMHTEIETYSNDCDSTMSSIRLEEKTDTLTVDEEQCITHQLLDSDFNP